MLQSGPKFTLMSHLISRLNRCAPRVQLSMSTRRFVHSSISVRGGQQAVGQGQGQGQEQSSASERANPAPSTQEKADSPALDSSIEIETVAARASANASPNVQPLLFSQTRAVQWSAAKTFRRAPNPDRPWYQGYVISFSYAPHSIPYSSLLLSALLFPSLIATVILFDVVILVFVCLIRVMSTLYCIELVFN